MFEGGFFARISCGKLGHLAGNLAGILWNFSGPLNKGSKYSGKGFGALLVRNRKCRDPAKTQPAKMQGFGGHTHTQ